MLVFALSTLPIWLITAISDVCGCGTHGASRCARAQFLAKLVSYAWYFAFRVCCWIRIDTSGLAALQDAGRSGRSVFIAMNHVSFLDTPIICAFMPCHLVGDVKTLMSKRFMRMPILSRLAKAIGHMPVPFHSSNRGDHKVDKDEMEGVLKEIDRHVEKGGHLCIFPEGDLNRQWWTLQQFRAGGMEICIRHDMELWGWITAGAATSWPKGVAVGGSPANLRARAVLLHRSAKEAARELAGGADDIRAQALALANDAQKQMQKFLDGMVEESEKMPLLEAPL